MFLFSTDYYFVRTIANFNSLYVIYQCNYRHCFFVIFTFFFCSESYQVDEKNIQIKLFLFKFPSLILFLKDLSDSRYRLAEFWDKIFSWLISDLFLHLAAITRYWGEYSLNIKVRSVKLEWKSCFLCDLNSYLISREHLILSTTA